MERDAMGMGTIFPAGRREPVFLLDYYHFLPHIPQANGLPDLQFVVDFTGGKCSITSCQNSAIR
jgi:hypothetical protein